MHRQGNSLFPESEFAPMEPPVLERVVADSQPSSSSCSTCSLEPLLTSIQYKTGITFEGYIVKTRKGRGCFTWTSGLSYIGEFKEDKREGYGKLKWPDGSTYEGHFHNDIREGEGMHKWEDSREVYEGKYHNDKRHGQGIYKWPSGATFVGKFKEDLKSGQGTYISPYGEKFEGFYFSDMRQGEGVVSYPGGHQDVGIWKGEKLIRLKFAVKEVTLDPLPIQQLSRCGRLHTPDLKSRGPYGPKGFLEVASQEFIQEAACGNMSQVKAIMENGAVHVDVVDKKGHSALFAAAVNGNSDIVNFLLDNGADINQRDENGVSVLSACHHVLFSSHSKVKVLLDQLHDLLPPHVPAQSSDLSSGDGDTEILYTSDFCSTHLDEEEEEEELEVGGASGKKLDYAGSMSRSRSLMALDQHQKMSRGKDLYRTKSFPFLLKYPADKHVQFRAGQVCDDAGIEAGWSDVTAKNEMKRVGSVKSKEIYIAYSLFSDYPFNDELRNQGDGEKGEGTGAAVEEGDGGKGGGTGAAVEEGGGGTGAAVEEGDGGKGGGTGTAVEEGGGGKGEGTGAAVEEGDQPPQTQKHDESLTASATGEVVGMSTVNSASSDPGGGGEGCGNSRTHHLAWGEGLAGTSHSAAGSSGEHRSLSPCCTKSDLNLSLEMKTPPGGNSSLPDLTPAIRDLARHASPTVKSAISKNTPFHQQPKKHVTIPGLGPVDLPGSSVFSSARYGPIVSAAESTTLSCGSSEQNVAGSSPSTSSTAPAPVSPDLTQCALRLGDLVQLLLSRGADPNASSIPLQPMFYAVLVGDVAVTRKLLECGARADDCLPGELGGYTLLHIATGNISVYSSDIVGLLLQFGADPNSGGMRVDQEHAMNGEGDSGAEKEIAREVEHMNMVSGEKRKLFLSGEIEGGIKVTPLHSLCSVQIQSGEDRVELSRLIPELIRILVKHGVDVNSIANGHSPMALAIINGHNSAVEVLLENNADPNLPLGKGVGNAICALTICKAHKSRAPVSISASLSLLHLLILSGADVFAKVMLAKRRVGTVLDFAYAALREDRRLSFLRYDSLTKAERACHRSSKKLILYLRNLFRCKALLNFASKDDLLYQLEIRTRVTTKPTTSPNTNFLQVFSDSKKPVQPAEDPPSSPPLPPPPVPQERVSLSAGAVPRSQTPNKDKPLVVWLPDVTLRASLRSLSKVIRQGSGSEEVHVIEDQVTSPLSETAPRFVRYKELLEKAGNILGYYTKANMDRKLEWLNFHSFCYECGKSIGVHLDVCAVCHMVSYCSRSCRRENWRKGHKDECNKAARRTRMVMGRAGRASRTTPRRRPNTGI